MAESTIGRIGKVIKEAAHNGVTEETLMAAALDWSDKGLNPSTLSSFIDGEIGKRTASTHRDRERCPEHESYYADNCPYH